MIAIVSAIYGRYDMPVVVPPQKGFEFQQTIVTDDNDRLPILHALDQAPQIIYAPRNHLHPRMAAKVPKCRPDLYVGTDFEAIIWIDGSIEVNSPNFLVWAMRESEGHAISQLAHPLRDDVTEEAHASLGMLKYQGQDVLGQAEAYVRMGLPAHSGLWATGLIVYRPSPIGVGFGSAWLTEQLLWTYQDQISQPYVAWKLGVEIHTLPGDLFNPPHFGLRGHRDER